MKLGVNEHNPYPRVRRNGKLCYRHREAAAIKLGRQLRAGETVHHKNGDKTDWNVDNIVVFSSHSAHMLYENYLMRQAKGIKHLFGIEEILEIRGEWMRG